MYYCFDHKDIIWIFDQYPNSYKLFTKQNCSYVCFQTVWLIIYIFTKLLSLYLFVWSLFFHVVYIFQSILFYMHMDMYLLALFVNFIRDITQKSKQCEMVRYRQKEGVPILNYSQHWNMIELIIIINYHSIQFYLLFFIFPLWIVYGMEPEKHDARIPGNSFKFVSYRVLILHVNRYG